MGGAAASNPWLERRPFHWAHQGGAKEAPSNTLHAMQHAREAGAHGLELDVHRSRDNRIVVIHDHTLHRTTNRSGWVRQHSTGELAGFDAAYWWVPGQVDNHEATTPEAKYKLRGEVEKNPDLGVPTLDDLLARHGDLPMTIEVKDPGAVERLVDELTDHGVPNDRLIVTSFSDEVVGRLRRHPRHLPLAPGRRWTAWFVIRARLHLPVPKRGPYVALQVPHWYPWKEILPGRLGLLVPDRWSVRFITGRVVRAAHRAGLAVHAWTIDDEAEMHELLDLGVDGIMTDCPSVLTRVLAKRRGG